MTFFPTPQRLAVFQLKHIGDLIITLPALALVKKRFPGLCLAMVTRPEVAPLAAAHPLVDEVFPLDPQPVRWGRAWNLAGRLRKRGYDCSLAFDAKRWSGLISLMAGIGNRLSSDAMGPILSWPNSLVFSRQIKLDWRGGESTAYRYQRFAAEAFGPPLDEKEGLLSVTPPILPPAALEKAEALASELAGPGPKIVLTLSGRLPEKNWPMEEFARLAALLYDKSRARLFITGSAGESPLAEKVRELSEAPLLNLCGRTDLLELQAFLRKADLLISVDTGTAHMAALAGIPQVTIFVGSSPVLWAPQNPQGRILALESLDRLYGRPKNLDYKCFPAITAETVLAEALELLGPETLRLFTKPHGYCFG